MTESLLLIDDDADVLRSVGDYFERIGYEVSRATTGGDGIDAFERLRPDVVILDLHLPDMGGLEVLERLRAIGAAVILMTGQGDIETAVRAMQLGAENFLTKPVDMNHLAAATMRVAEKVRLSRQNALLRARDHLTEGLETIGVSPAMRELARQVGLLASSESTVLLTGETGTGKGWVARIIHQLSSRAAGPFVEVNCGGRSATLLDSELFGHEKGAFTDAKERRQGLFELADGGTIFLDGIGELGIELQPKLLKVIETKTFRRLGGTHELKVDVRLMAATNRDLAADVKAGRFREDLFYRLSVSPVHLPLVARAVSGGSPGAAHPHPRGPPCGVAGAAGQLQHRSARPAADGAVAGERARDAERARARDDPGARIERDWRGAPARRPATRGGAGPAARAAGAVRSGAAPHRTHAPRPRRQPHAGGAGARDLAGDADQQDQGVRAGSLTSLA